jgi:hypothetical protein
MKRLRVSQVAGYEELRVSRSVKRAITSALLAIPLAMTAVAISDSAVVSNAFRYVFSPGTMFAFRFVKVEASHRGLGVFLDVMSAYGRMMDVALLIDAIFYGLLAFGFITIVSAVRSESGPT